MEFRPAMPRADLLAVTRTSDIGLAVIPRQSCNPNFQAMTGASNKVFDYMACGLPVIVSDLPDWRELFVDTGYGLACEPDDAESIAAAIRQLIQDRKRMRQMGEAGRQRILDEWNYETVFRPILHHLCKDAANPTSISESNERETTRRSV